jgi:hypothetical protein
MNTFEPNLDTLPNAQRILLSSLRPLRQLGFVLYGGTAIALRLGHRESVDFRERERDPDQGGYRHGGFAYCFDAVTSTRRAGVHPNTGWDSQRPCRKEEDPNAGRELIGRSATLRFGGGGGIRTHGALRLSGFQDRRDRPLCHPSSSSPLSEKKTKISTGNLIFSKPGAATKKISALHHSCQISQKEQKHVSLRFENRQWKAGQMQANSLRRTGVTIGWSLETFP